MAVKVAKAKPPSISLRAPHLTTDPQSLMSAFWPLEQMLHLQAELLKAAESNLSGWLNRRREGTTAALRAREKFVACRDFGEALAIQSEWVDGAAKRLDLDLQDATDHLLAISQCALGATQQATQTTTEIAARGAEWVVRAVEPVADRQATSDVVERAAPVARSGAPESSGAAKAAA